MNRLRKRIIVNSRIAKSFTSDFLYNPFPQKGNRHILFVRDIYNQQFYNRRFLNWIKRNFPKAMDYIRLGRLSRHPIPLDGTQAIIQFLSYPVPEIYPHTYKKAKELEDRADQRGIRIINSIRHYPNTFKSNALNIIRDVGIRTGKCVLVKNGKDFNPGDHGIPYPFILRENIRHKINTQLIQNKKELDQVDWSIYQFPVAIEFVDSMDKDGLYRKYRYILAGDKGCPRHLQISKNWNIHNRVRLINNNTAKEELAYMQIDKDPNHDLLNEARKALKLDTVTFDIGYDKDGKLVVWEPNPLPSYWSRIDDIMDIKYQHPTLHRLFKMLMEYYFEAAGMDEELSEVLKFGPQVENDYIPTFLEPARTE